MSLLKTQNSGEFYLFFNDSFSLCIVIPPSTINKKQMTNNDCCCFSCFWLLVNSKVKELMTILLEQRVSLNA